MSEVSPWHAYQNARRLYNDAELLRSHGRLHSAYALAILSLEEVGRAVLIAEDRYEPRAQNLHIEKLTRAESWMLQVRSYFDPFDKIIADLLPHAELTLNERSTVARFLEKRKLKQRDGEYEGLFGKVIVILDRRRDWLEKAMKARVKSTHQDRLEYFYGGNEPKVAEFSDIHLEAILGDLWAGLEELDSDLALRRYGMPSTFPHAVDDTEQR
jgi:hypothetical protein